MLELQLFSDNVNEENENKNTMGKSNVTVQETNLAP